MTKKEKHKLINKEFYEFVNEFFPQYIIDDSEGYGRVSLVNTESENRDDCIEYHQSRHDLCSFNWSSDECKEDEAKMEEKLEELMRKYEL